MAIAADSFALAVFFTPFRSLMVFRTDFTHLQNFELNDTICFLDD
uniref:Uncharacterized protein n=1 Tax=viral metagenome TaxID=1070528 RepID=A0A6C0BHS9_9ZZZZ